jgi:transcriptional regulator of aromatic amino acid metabolism
MSRKTAISFDDVEDLQAEIERLRSRTHEIQERADNTIAGLKLVIQEQGLRLDDQFHTRRLAREYMTSATRNPAYTQGMHMSQNEAAAIGNLLAENERLRRVAEEADKLMRSHAALSAELPLRVALDALAIQPPARATEGT